MQTKLDTFQEEYKQTELGSLPKEWEVAKLGDVAEFETGKRMKGGALKSGDVLSLGGEHIGDFGVINLSEPKFISKQFYDNLKKGRLKDDDVIICKDGAKTGKVAYIKELATKYMAVNEHIFIIRRRNPNQLLNQFVFYSLFSEIGQKQVKEAYHGLIGGITNSDISNFKIPLPPLEEQKRIAFVLSTIQTAKEKTEKVIQATKELKKSMMKHLFTYGPVSLEDAEKVKLKETEIGMVPEEWEVVPLGEIANVKYGKANPKDKGDVPVVGSGGIYSGTTKALVDKPTIVIGRKGTAGKSWLMLEPCYPSDTTFYLDWKKEVDVKFIFNYMVLRPLSGEHAKTTLPSLQKPELDKMKLPLPPLPIQQKIASILSAIDEKIQAEENKKKALEELFKSMLHNLMTAKIRVKDFKVAEAN